jgi:tetratricopeptide (TPR) repeat protein
MSAIKDYSVVIMLNENKNAYRNRALLYWELGDNENALYDLYEAKSIAPMNAKVRTLLALGLHKVNRLGDSYEEYSAVI